MAEGFAIGRGFIEAELVIDESKMKRTAEDAGDRAGSGFAKRFADKAKGAAGSIGKGFSGMLSKAAGPAMMGALMPVMMAGGPLLGSALAVGLTGALIAGLGVAGIGAGIALVADSPQVKGAFDGLKKQVTTGLKEAAKPFIGPVVQSINIFKKTFDQILPSIQRIFKFLAPYVTQFAQGISDAIIKVMPAIENVIMNSGPLLTGMANGISSIGGAIAGFLNGAVKLFNNVKALWSGEGGAGPFSNLPKIIEKVKALGGTFAEIFNQIKTVILENKTQFQTFINFILGISNILWSGVGPVFKALGAAIKAVIGILGGLIDFFAGVFTGDWKRAGDGIKKIWDSLWNGIKGIVSNVGTAIKNIALGIWNGIKGSVLGFKNWFVNGWSTMWTNAKNTIINAGNSIKDGFMSRFNSLKNNLSTAINGVKGFITSMRDHIGTMVRSIGDKFSSFKTNTIAAFTAAKDGVKKVWDKLKEVAKSPVNFVIDPVYARIRELWNNVAGKVGLGSLPVVNKFARGGIAPGTGRGDTVPAMLTPGEGILTVDEMRKLGGPKGFSQLRDQIQHFADGGIVGWMKDKVGGAIRGGLHKVAKSAADKWVFPAINQLQGGDGFPGLMKAGASTLINKVLGWLKADDKKNPIGAGGNVGYKRMMEILRQQFPGLPLISGFRPGSRTLSGNRSYHASGRAVDVKPSAAIAKFIHDNYKSATKELITPYQQYNLNNGRSRRYTGAVWNQHNYAGGNAHTHWAMDNGGVLPPRSTTTITNATREKEYALTLAQLRNTAGKTININTPGAIVLDMSKYKNIDDVMEAVVNLETYLNQGIV